MNKIIENLVFGLVVTVLLAASAAPSFSQKTPAPPQQIAPFPGRGPVGLPPTLAPTMGGDTTERSLKVDGSVNISLCVSQGTINVNSWKRSELRVFVHDGSKFGFKVQQKSEKTGDPALVMVMATEAKNKYAPECISGGEIEIDVPTNATVNIKGHDVDSTIDSVRKASVQVGGGNISMRNIAQGILAKTWQGGVTIEESKGPMEVETTNGNIVVFEAGPSEIGDTFTARTNGGTISLQKVEHRQLDVSSITGSVAYNGAILSGGSYSLRTTNGSIRLAIPVGSACTVNATYGYGSFDSELPFKVMTETITEGPVKTVVGTFGGGGDAVIKLTVSNNGSIAVKKL